MTAPVQSVRCEQQTRRGSIRSAVADRSPEDQTFTEDAANVIAFSTPTFGSSHSEAVFLRDSATEPNTLAVLLPLCRPAVLHVGAGIGVVLEGAVCGGIGGRGIQRIP